MIYSHYWCWLLHTTTLPLPRHFIAIPDHRCGWLTAGDGSCTMAAAWSAKNQGRAAK